MSQRSVEIVIGRLVSDEDLRERFRRDARAALARLRESGLELSAIELEALAGLSAPALDRLARALDGRLQRASLAPKRRAQRGALLDPAPARARNRR